MLPQIPKSLELAPSLVTPFSTGLQTATAEAMPLAPGASWGDSQVSNFVNGKRENGKHHFMFIDIPLQ